MNFWLTIRTGIAIFLTIFGLGLVFMRSGDERMLIGSAISAVGGTFLVHLWRASSGLR